jgi:hypothetical protein
MERAAKRECYAAYCHAYLWGDSSEEYRVIGREPDRSRLESEFENAEEIPHTRGEVGRERTEVSRTVERVFTAPRKFWVVAKKETRWSWEKPKDTSYEVLEARGPFPSEEEAVDRVVRDGRLSVLFG